VPVFTQAEAVLVRLDELKPIPTSIGVK
jgi:hypothetical protein